MTGSRDVRLLRVPHLRGAHRVLTELAGTSPQAVVLVPTRHAAEEVRRALLDAGIDVDAFPSVLTRHEWHVDLHVRMAGAARLLGAIEREVLVARAADTAIAAGITPPFVVRPGLIGEMLHLYDGVRRNRRTVDDVERVLVAALEPGSDIDRGAARLLEQTRFLIAVFHAYEATLERLDVLDEHRLRDRVAGAAIVAPVQHLIVTTGDEAIGEGGLWPADFDLLTRLPGLTHVDVIATERDLDAGFRERLFDLLPGIEEHRRGETAEDRPVLIVPEDPASPPYHVHRDREEELSAIVRRLGDRRERVAIVYQRPLPYVYLARRVFERAGVPFTTADTLPLAAEPYVAAVDLACEAIVAERAREPLLRLLESPMLTWRPHRRALASEDVQILREWWSAHPAADPAGVADKWERRGRPVRHGRLRRARAAAAAAVAELRTFDQERPRSEHLRAFAALLMERTPAGAFSERTGRARGAVLALIDELALAYERHGDDAVPFRQLVPVVRRAIEQHTFAPASGSGGGVRLIDARTARYTQADEVWIVGINEGEWPLPSRRSVFYPSGLLRDLGFAGEQVRQAHARAAFHDLLSLAHEATGLSVFQLEEDSIVRPSVLLEDLGDDDPQPVSVAIPSGGAAAAEAAPSADADRWRAWRETHLPPGDPRRHGLAGPPPSRVLSVTQVERYLDCPFRFFSSVVLGLEEEDDHHEIGLDPRRRGTLVHQVFQTFFDRWGAEAHGAIAPSDLPAARALLEEVATRELASLPEADRVVERMRLLGSAAGPGLGERVFRLEALTPEPVVERLLEYDLRGTYRFGRDEPRDVTLKGIADRIDLLANGTLRLIDYKTGKAPDPHRSIQLAVYALCAEQKLEGHLGRRWRVGQAAYLALGDPRAWVPVVRSPDDRASLDAAEQRVLEAFAGIAAGAFGPAPADRRLCRVCGFSAVCRKDYVDEVA